jgi:hypothetical protein
MPFHELEIPAIGDSDLSFPSILPVYYHACKIAHALLGPHSYGYFIIAGISDQLRSNRLQQILVSAATDGDSTRLTAVGILIRSVP